MPPQALVLALGASIYPPAVAAVIALGRGPQVRSRVFVFVLAAILVTYAVGALMLLVLIELGVSGPGHRTPSATVELVIGAGLLVLGVWLYRRRARAPSTGEGPPSPSTGEGPPSPSTGESSPGPPSKLERYLHNRRLAFVLGLTLYVVPSPIYIAAIKTLSDASLSTSSELLALAAIVAVMLWLIELPALMLVAVPARAVDTLERLNRWFGRHGRALAIVASAGAGIYLIVHGIGRLPG
jgi:hypothetical protein